MKKTVIIVVGLFITRIMQAQGTIYLDNLGQTSTGAVVVGSDSWLAADFFTGNNTDGYTLDSVQLPMADTTGNPNAFTVMIYTDVGGTGPNPGSSLDTLDGSDNPSTTGIYTYTPDTDLTLSPNTSYFIVATAGTAVATGAYEWNVTSTSSPGYNSYHWGGGQISLGQSSNGINWNFTSDTYGQFSLTATAIPEPSPSLLLLLGSGVFIYVRRTFHR